MDTIDGRHFMAAGVAIRQQGLDLVTPPTTLAGYRVGYVYVTPDGDADVFTQDGDRVSILGHTFQNGTVVTREAVLAYLADPALRGAGFDWPGEGA